MNDFLIGQWAIYKGEKVEIVDDYGHEVYCIDLTGTWKSVHASELIPVESDEAI